MKKLLLLFTAIASTGIAVAETVTINEVDYKISTLIDRDLGPGVRYTRLRIPDFPLNVNMLRIDVTNPYVSVETTQANDRLFNTESLVTAAKRQTTTGHVALAGANANFWCVSGQEPFSDQLIGVTYNGNLRNGKIITETNCSADQWDHGPSHTGIVGITPDNKVFSGNNWTWCGTVTSATGTANINTVNKTVRPGELGLYNSYHGETRSFRPVNLVGKNFVIASNVSTEVYLSLVEGQEWKTGSDMLFTVKEVKQNAGDGCVGSYDAVLVGRDNNANYLNTLTVGSQIAISTSWISPEGQPVAFKNLVGGNAQVMSKSQLLEANDNETYNSQIYSRTGYGTNADGTMLYIIVIDKSGDRIYGSSAGCNTRAMCAIAAHYGCTDMTNFDAGGSAEMFVKDAIVNTTTEGTPRAVANGMLAYSIAPEDNVITRLEFYDYELSAPLFGSYSPRIIAYNQYGAVVTDDLKGFVLSCPEVAGTCNGEEYTAGATAGATTLTATYNNVSVTKTMTVIEAQPSIRIKPQIVINNSRNYKFEVNASADGNTYTFNPAGIDWQITDESVATVDADGVLHGLKNGTTDITAVIGNFTDKTSVSVEIPDAPSKALFTGTQDPKDWTVTKISMSDCAVSALDENGGISLDYKVSSARSPRITAACNCRVFSLPDAFEIDIQPGTAAVKQIGLAIKTASKAQATIVYKNVTLTPSTKNTVRFEASEFGDITDLASFPLSFTSISVSSSDKSGTTCHVEIPAIRAVYNNFVDAVDDIIADENNSNASPEFFNLQGIRVNGQQLQPGIYIQRNGSSAKKIVVK